MKAAKISHLTDTADHSEIESLELDKEKLRLPPTSTSPMVR